MSLTPRAILQGVLPFALGCSSALAQVIPPDIGTTIREIEQRRPEVPPQRSPSLQVDQPARPSLQASAPVRRLVRLLRCHHRSAHLPLA